MLNNVGDVLLSSFCYYFIRQMACGLWLLYVPFPQCFCCISYFKFLFSIFFRNVFQNIYFIYLKCRVTEVKGVTEEEIFHLLIHCTNGHNSQGLPGSSQEWEHQLGFLHGWRVPAHSLSSAAFLDVPAGRWLELKEPKTTGLITFKFTDFFLDSLIV